MAHELLRAVSKLISTPGLPPRKRFTRQQVRKMLNAGVFAGQKFELINGEIIDKVGQSPPLASAVRLVMDWATATFGRGRARV